MRYNSKESLGASVAEEMCFQFSSLLQCLNLWSLEERRNSQDLVEELFKMSKGMTGIRFQELFTLEDNNKGTGWRHSLKLTKLRCTRDCWKGVQTLRTKDTSDLPNFGPRTLPHVRSVSTLQHWCQSVFCMLR